MFSFFFGGLGQGVKKKNKTTGRDVIQITRPCIDMFKKCRAAHYEFGSQINKRKREVAQIYSFAIDKKNLQEMGAEQTEGAAEVAAVYEEMRKAEEYATVC